MFALLYRLRQTSSIEIREGARVWLNRGIDSEYILVGPRDGSLRFVDMAANIRELLNCTGRSSAPLGTRRSSSTPRPGSLLQEIADSLGK